MRSSRSRFNDPSHASAGARGVRHRPTPRAARTRLSGLARDHEPIRVRVQGLRDHLLADVGPVRVGRVDQLTPSSTARRSTESDSSWSRGGPQMPSPVIRIAPYPSRFTSRPPILIVPAGIAEPYNAPTGRGTRSVPTFGRPNEQ